MKHGEDKLQKKIEGALNSAERLLIMSGCGNKSKYYAEKYWKDIVIYNESKICNDSIVCSMDFALNLYGLLGEDDRLRSDVRNLGLKQILWGLLNRRGNDEIKFNKALFNLYYDQEYELDSEEQQILDALHMLTSNGDLSDHIITVIDELHKYLGVERFPNYIQDIILSTPQNVKGNDFIDIAGDSEDECLASYSK